MDSHSDHIAHDDQLYSGRRLKIRRFPSCKLSAGPSAKRSSSFHGICASATTNQQPLIIHTFDPEIIVTEPDEFMWVVQRLTGSSDTRRSLRASKRKRKEVQPMQVQDVQLLQQSNYISLIKEDTQTCTEAAPMTGDSSTNFSMKDQPSSPLSSNSSELSSNCINPLGLPLSSDTNYQLNFKISPLSCSKYANYLKQKSEHPSSPISCNYHPLYLINPNNPSTLKINTNPSPLSPNYPTNPTINTNPSLLSLNSSNLNTITINKNPLLSFPSPCTLTINNNPSPISSNPNNFTDNNDLTSPLSPISCNSGITNHLSSPIYSSIIKPTEGNNSRCHPGSPVSPTSGLTTTSSEDCHTDLSTESCASPMQEPLSPKQGSNSMDADEDGSNFFVFSFDSYYGSHGVQDDLEFIHSTNVLVESSCSSMTLTPTEALNLSFFKDLTTWHPMKQDEVEA